MVERGGREMVGERREREGGTERGKGGGRQGKRALCEVYLRCELL